MTIKEIQEKFKLGMRVKRDGKVGVITAYAGKFLEVNVAEETQYWYWDDIKECV